MEQRKIVKFERHELKYLVDLETKKKLLEDMRERIEDDPYGSYQICNIYYDTPDWRLIRTSVEGKIYKEKLRLRSYGRAKDGQSVYLEMKKKYDRIVYKRRISIPVEEAMDFVAGKKELSNKSQIGNELEYFCRFYKNLKPAVHLSYFREAYFEKDDPELRITFDSNILWRTENVDLKTDPYGRKILDDNTSLMEIKVGDAMPLWLAQLLEKYDVRRTSISKYGRAYQTILEEKLKGSKTVC